MKFPTPNKKLFRQKIKMPPSKNRLPKRPRRKQMQQLVQPLLQLVHAVS
jgi:hypothetical protein